VNPVSDTPEKTEKKDEKAAEAAGMPKADAPEATREPRAKAEAEDTAAEGSDAEEPTAAEEDDASPEAIARRVAALGEEDETEKIARSEEEKLAARRAKMKRGKKGGGLEAAASKRLARIAEKAQPKKMIATAVDGADPLLNQTAALSKWAKKNQKVVSSVVLAGAVALAGVGGYNYWQQKKEADASAELTKAVADERGRIGDPDKEKEEEASNGPKDTRPLFKTVDERRESALKKFRDVESRFPGTGAAILARLSEGSLLLDARQADPAIAAFNDVRSSALGQMDAEVRGRALEGLGFAYEQKGNLDESIKTFKDLEATVDVLGFKELAMYHQARVLEARNSGGDKDKAKELLKTVHERINKPGENYPFPYLKEVADDRLRALDPTALPPKPSGQMGGPGGNKMSEEQIKKLIEQLKKQQGGGAP
jgi:hypothetical protein